MDKLLSVSVAAYNVEAFIEQCLDSFLEPEVIEKVEVLVTDDGSKDRTPEIVAEYEKKYPGTFRLIRQPNAGPGSTVNSGIKHAVGKYFRMVDGDDWVNTKNMAEYLKYLETHDTDMVCTNYCLVDHETGQKKEELLNISGVQKNQDIPFASVCDRLYLDMHNVTYRTEILQKNAVVLDNCFYTDLEYLLLPTPYIRTIAFLDTIIYMYRVSLSTQSMNINSLQRNTAMHMKVLMRLSKEYQTYKESDLWDEAKGAYYCKRIAAMAGTQLSINLSMEDKEKYRKETVQLVRTFYKKYNDIYKELFSMKTYRVLIRSHFRLYSIVSALHRKKLGLK